METLLQDLEFHKQVWGPLVSVILSNYPLILLIMLMFYIIKRMGPNGKKQLEYPDYHEKNESSNQEVKDEIGGFKAGDFMSLAEIAEVMNLKRSATAIRVKEVGLKPWKFGDNPTYMYLRKDVMALFKPVDEE